MKKLNLAIIGQGKSGKDIHGGYYVKPVNEYFNVAYVVEKDARRAETARSRYEGCVVLSDYEQLFDKKDIDVVVNASYSFQHFAISKDLLEHGFNVAVEKPFARNMFECETLINTAKKNGKVLAVFHQSLYAPFFEDALNVIKSGKIGEVKEINIRYNCLSRRWDWQTLQKKMGGNAYNTGPHPISIGLGLLGNDKNSRIVYSKLANTSMSFGDADDFVKIIIETPDKPLLDIEINNTDAFTDYNVKLQGTRGTFKCTPASYKCKYIIEGENPSHTYVEGTLEDENGNPVYCIEKLNFHEESGNYVGTAFDEGTRLFYEDLYRVLTQGGEMKHSAETAKNTVGVIEAVHGANPLPLKF